MKNSQTTLDKLLPSYLQNINKSSLSPHPSSLQNFIYLGKIGHGAFSQVYKVRRITDSKIYALKKIKLSSLKQKQQQYAISQIKILAALQSKYIISFRQSFYQQKNKQLCIVMEWANEGDLQNQIQKRKKLINQILTYNNNTNINHNIYQYPQYNNKNTNKTNINNKNFPQFQHYIPQCQIWIAIHNILSGIVLLHQSSILHRDIKSANIFKSQGIYKLGDLNIAKICSGLPCAYTQTGTPYYASPEIWKQLPYNTKSDIWSFGCVIYQMCQLVPPFMAKDMKKLYQIVIQGKYKNINFHFYSQQLGKLISICLQINAKDRLQAKQILELDWVKKKFKQYHVKFDQNINITQNENCNNEIGIQQIQKNAIKQEIYNNNINLIQNSHSTAKNNNNIYNKQLSIQLSKQLRQIRSITQPSSIISSSKLLLNILPSSKYPQEKNKSINKSKISNNNNKSYRYNNNNSNCSNNKSIEKSNINNQQLILQVNKQKGNLNQIQEKQIKQHIKQNKSIKNRNKFLTQIDISQSTYMQTQKKQQSQTNNNSLNKIKNMRKNNSNIQINNDNIQQNSINVNKKQQKHKKSKKRILMIPTQIHNYHNKYYINTKSNQQINKYKYNNLTRNISHNNKYNINNNISKQNMPKIQKTQQNKQYDIKNQVFQVRKIINDRKYKIGLNINVNSIRNRRPISSYNRNRSYNHNNIIKNNNNNIINNINTNININENLNNNTQIYNKIQKQRPSSADNKLKQSNYTNIHKSNNKYIGTLYNPNSYTYNNNNNKYQLKTQQIYSQYNTKINNNNQIYQSIDNLKNIKNILNQRSNNYVNQNNMKVSINSHNNVGKLYYNYNNNNIINSINSINKVNLNNINNNISNRNYIKDVKIYKNIYKNNIISHNYNNI